MCSNNSTINQSQGFLSETVQLQLNFFRQKMLEEVIPNEIYSFTKSNKCCRPFYYLKSSHKAAIHKIARNNGLYSQDERDPKGMEYVRIYKKTCACFIKDETQIILSEESRIQIQKLLKIRPVTAFEQDCTNSDIMRPMATKPKLETHLFCIGSQKDSVPCPKIAINMRSSNDYNKVLDSINSNRVTIVAANKGFGKSTVIPKLIVQEYAQRGENCKIVVVGTHRTTAITNSESVAESLGQQIGNTVAFQVRLESQTNENSNLIYTTSLFFLRCLMGRIAKEALNKVTHIIIDDCQEHNPYSDLTMFEIKDVLIFLPTLKVILLTTPDFSIPLKNYFGEGSILCFPGHIENITRVYLEDILENFNIDLNLLIHTSVMNKLDKRINPGKEIQITIDKLLDDYMLIGSDQSFNILIFTLDSHELSVDIQHSISKITALMCAASNNRLDHLKILMIEKKANAWIYDSHFKTAMAYANFQKFFDCSDFINKCLRDKELLELSLSYKTCLYQDFREKAEGMHIDIKLITELVKWIFSTYSMVEHNVVVIYLPSYEYIIRTQYHLLLQKIVGEIPYDVDICLVHDDIQRDQLFKLQTEKSHKRILLTTSILESVIKINNVSFIIDSGKISRDVCIPEISDHQKQIQWISKDRANRRCISGVKTVFRLYTKQQYSNFKQSCDPELQIMPLDRITMFAKQLQPYKRVVDYFSEVISPPPPENVETVLNILQSTGVFSDNEDITWLGVRLLDVHIDVRLGKMLVYGIVLQCIDPILTLVASLSCSDPLEIPTIGTFSPHDEVIQQRILKKRQSLCDSYLSDHLMLIKLYNEWQDKHDMSSTDFPLEDEVAFLQNGILEKICGMRAYIVGTLRSAKLVHKMGPLNMTSLNQRSNSWALIKACIIGGMFPNCCQIDIEDDNFTYKIKSGNNKNIVLSTNSSLVKNTNNTSSIKKLMFFVFQNSKTSSLSYYQSVERISAVTPISMVLFSGEANLGRFAFSIPEQKHQNSNLITTTNWLNFAASSKDTELLYDLRCKFFNVFFDVIQTCHNAEKWEKYSKYHNNNNILNHHEVIKTIEKVLTIEECDSNLMAPSNIGDRPRAFSHKFALAATTSFTESEKKYIDADKMLAYFQFLKPPYYQKGRNRKFYIYKIEQKSALKAHTQIFSYGHELDLNSQMANFIVDFIFKDLNQIAYVFFYAKQEKEILNVSEIFSDNIDQKTKILFEEVLRLNTKADGFQKLYKQTIDSFEHNIVEINPELGECFLKQCAFRDPEI